MVGASLFSSGLDGSLGRGLRLGAAAGGQAQDHHSGQSKSKQLLFHHNDLLLYLENLIKNGPVRWDRAAFHTSSVKPDDLFLDVIKSARIADLHKRIGDHRNREGHVHMKTPFRPPAGFATFAVYSFKGVKSTVIFYKIRGGNRTERTEKPRRKGKRLEMRPFSFWAKYSGMHAWEKISR